MFGSDAFLKFTDREVLTNPGTISAKIAKSRAESKFEKYRITQDRLFKSDFDKTVKQIEAAVKLNTKT